MKVLIYILVFMIPALFGKTLVAQTTTFTADPGRWTDAVNWDNGLPNSTIDAIIEGTCRTPVGAGDCKNLEISTGRRLVISIGIEINIFGELNVETGSTIIYNGGGIKVHDDIFLNNSRKIEVAGSVQFISNFDIGQ